MVTEWSVVLGVLEGPGYSPVPHRCIYRDTGSQGAVQCSMSGIMGSYGGL